MSNKTKKTNAVCKYISDTPYSLCAYDNEDWEKFKNGEMVIECGCITPQLKNISEVALDDIFDFDVVLERLKKEYPDDSEESFMADTDDMSGKYFTYEIWSNINDYTDYGWDVLELDVSGKHVVTFIGRYY